MWPVLVAGLSSIIVGEERRGRRIVVSVDRPTFRLFGYPGDLMDADLLPELSGETCIDEVTVDLPPATSEPDLIVASRLDETLITVRKWVQSGSAKS